MVPLLLVARDWFDVATGVAQMITALAIVAVVVFAAGTAWAIRAATRAAAASLDEARGELVPLLQQARAIADDVKAMTGSARDEVERVRALVQDTTGKVEAGLAAAEARLKRLDALAGAVQDEAEDAVVAATAAMRGAQATLRGMRAVFRRRPRRDEAALEGGDDAGDEAASDTASPADERPAIAPARGERPRRRRRRGDGAA